MRYVIRERFFHLGEDSDITDEYGQPVYHVDGKVLSLRNTLIVRDVAGNEVATVERKLIALTPTYQIALKGREGATLRKQLFSPFIDRFTIDVPGPHDLHMTGSLFEHDYTISRDGRVIAAVSRAWISITDTFGVETAPGEDDLLILASVLALDLAQDREEQRDRG